MLVRKARHEDTDFLFNLRNEEAVRVVSFNSEPISLDVHKKWFEEKVVALDSLILIVEVDGQSMAQVRFDSMDGSDLKKSKEVEINVALVSAFRGRGYGSEIIRLASAKIFNEYPVVSYITALIKPDNAASLRSFANAGYASVGYKIEKGQTCIDMMLSR